MRGRLHQGENECGGQRLGDVDAGQAGSQKMKGEAGNDQSHVHDRTEAKYDGGGTEERIERGGEIGKQPGTSPGKDRKTNHNSNHDSERKPGVSIGL